ncbi:MAG: hypothetical protein ACP5SH_12240 [Syntrophobacteraceae bacterium]
MLLSFILQLREAEIPVSVRYILEFYEGIQKGLAPDIDRLFLLARLVFVKKVEHYDAFERVFAAFFLGQGGAQPVEWEAAFAGKPFEEWLREQVARGAISLDELRTFEIDELLKRFRETLLQQEGAHHGGNRWIGTGGRSPYGHSGSVGGGVRVYGRGLHGTAQKVIDRRNYLNYSGKARLAESNVGQALALLKNLKRAGPETELEIEETIRRTAKNGGEIELVFAKEFRDRLKLVVLLDNGGYSMEPYLQLVKSVFTKIRDKFKDLKYYYFHNCLYGTVYENMERTRAVSWETLVSRGPDTHLIIIGDANMAPSELMAANGALYTYTSDRRPGIEWLKLLRTAFPASVWLNPVPKRYWSAESITIDRIGRIFPMEDLTLDGIRNAVQILMRKI